MSSVSYVDINSLSKQELIEKVGQLSKQVHTLNRRLVQQADRVAEPGKYRQRPFDFKRFRRRHVFLRFLYLGWQYSGLCMQRHSQLPTVEQQLFRGLCATRLVDPGWLTNRRRHFCGRTDKGVSAFSQVVSVVVRSCQPADMSDNASLFRAQLHHSNGGSSSGGGGSSVGGGGADDDSAGEADGGAVTSQDSDDFELFQLADISAESELDYAHMLNKVLPADIRVLAWAPVSPELSARFNCQMRVYRYFFPRRNLNLDLMQNAADRLLGEHDFRNMCKLSLRNGVLNYRRTIVSARVALVGDQESAAGQPAAAGVFHNDDVMCQLTIRGHAYLYHQIRCIMSVLLLVGEGKEHPSIVDELLDVKKNPRKPCYQLSLDLPLVLYCSEYDSDHVQWHSTAANTHTLINHLHSFWTETACKASVIRCMFDALSKDTGMAPTTYPQSIHGSYTGSCYVPLMKRRFCESLEERVESLAKRNRLPDNMLPLLLQQQQQQQQPRQAESVSCGAEQQNGADVVAAAVDDDDDDNMEQCSVEASANKP